jgi:predicted nucleic acid-binding protein
MTQQTIDKLRDIIETCEIGCTLNRRQTEFASKLARAALKFIETGGWMPIESCPKEDEQTYSLLFNRMRASGFYSHDDKAWYVLCLARDTSNIWRYRKHSEEPTHWMPLNPADRLLQMIEGGE